MDEDLDYEDYISDKDETEAQETRAKHINGATLIKKRGRSCPLCKGKFTHPRRHTLRAHLPWYLYPSTACWSCKLQFGQARFVQIHMIEVHSSDDVGCRYTDEQYEQKWVELVNGYLKQISNAFGFKEVSQACDYVNQNIRFRESCHQSTFLDEDISPILSFNRINHLEPDTAYMKPYPAVSLSSLLHWKVLSLLTLDSGYLDTSTEQRLQLYIPPVKINFVDSHFHLEKLRRRVGSSDFPQFNTDKDQIKNFLQFGISNYCFPKKWPSSSEREKIREDKRVRLTFGLHPRTVNYESPRTLQIWLEDLEGLLDSKKVVAVGECGLDITDRPSSKDFEKQKDILRKQARIAKQKRLPVVIHCRGNYDTSNECLRCLTANLPADHHIHRHCFNGSYAEYIKWKIAFPEVKFGISPFLLNEIKYPQFRELVCKMELGDLLLETDAPYLPGADGSTGSPLLVKDLAEKIANLHNVSTEEVARITTDNAKKLYKIKEL
ncbi:tatD [Mytilus edulis]|uniref:TatD n=1 Tax=Mytilus edulis TaxID=6550 RepID=A0A8S3SNJ8_MYTED|nr:tatD [Mytilus edulis]